MTTDTAINTDSPPPAVGRQQPRWLRLSGVIMVALIAMLLLAWLSFPAWAPYLAQRVMPDNWSLLSLDIERPGFSGLHVNRLEARGAEAGLRFSLSAQDTSVPFDRSLIDIQRLAMSLSGAPASEDEDPFELNDFSLPRLVFEGQLPEIRIGTLTLASPWPANGEPWTFRDLAIGNGAQGLSLNTVIPQAAPLNTDLEVSLVMDRDLVNLQVVSAQRPDLPILSFVQQPMESDPSQASAQLEWNWDLAMLDAGQLAQNTALVADMVPANLLGEVSGQIVFRGQDRLRPESGDLRLEEFALQAPAAGIKSSLNLDWAWDGSTVIAQLRALDMTATASGELILRELQSVLDKLGIDGLLGAKELSLSVVIPGAGTATPRAMKLEIDPVSPFASKVTGSAVIKANQKEAFELAFNVPRFAATIASGGAAGLKDWNLDADGTFRLFHPATFIDGEQTLGASAGSGVVSARIQNPDGIQSLNATLTDFNFEGVSLSQPGTAAIMSSLSISGTLEQAGTLSFNGQLAGKDLVLASEDQPLAPPLLSATSFSMPLQMDQPNATETEIRGPLLLSGVNLPVAAITSDAVTLDMSPITLPQLAGNLRLLTTGLVAEVDGIARAGLDLDLNGTVREGRFYEGDGELLLGYQAALPFGFSADLETTAGTMTFAEAKLPVEGLAALARPAGITLPKNLGFDTGQLIIDGEVQSNDSGISGALMITGQDLGLSLGESNLEGLNFTTQIDLADVLQGGGSVTLGIARLAAGLDLISLSSDLAISNSEEFGARSLTAQLLGGLISIPSISLKAGQLQDAQIEWEGFDLGRLLEFVDVGGLDGTGIMDARFPLVAEEGGPAVRNGSFAARGPGRLRYSTGVPAANIGLQALENFEYQSLSGTLDYGSDGGYTVGVELLGANPGLYNGYPIRFRLNLGGSMPALFRSLFITGDFEKGIIERLRAGEPVLEPETQ